MLINPFKGEDTVLNNLRFDFQGLVRLLQGLRLHFLPSSTACRKILLDFFLLSVLLCIYILFVSCLFLPKFGWLFCQCSAVNCVVFLTVWGKFSWLLHC